MQADSLIQWCIMSHNTARYGRYTLMACVRERHSGQRSIRCAHSQHVHIWPQAANTAPAGCSRQMAHRLSSLRQAQVDT